MKIRVGIFFGGSSVEHEVSVISALQAIEYINKEKYEIVPIYISKEKDLYTGNYLLDIENYQDLDKLKQNSEHVVIEKNKDEYNLVKVGWLRKVVAKIDVAFPIVHGQNVEDGSLAGFFETLGIPYVGSNVLASSLGQDKIVMKQVFASSNIPIVPYLWFFDYEYLNDKESILKRIEKLGYPVVVKPASLGSSVGINFVKDKKEIEKAIEDAINYDKKIIIEKGVDNLIEVNCSVLGNSTTQSTSLIEQVISSNNIL